MSVPPSVVDTSGNISVHGREGAVILVTLSGVTASDLSFEIQGSQAISLTATGAPDQYQLVITQTVVDAVPDGGAMFALRNLAGVVPVVEWEGTIKRRGFTAP